MNKKVYVLMDGGHDYSAAQEWGELVMCDLPPSISYNTARIYATLKEKMQNASEEDYVLISGITTFCCIATSIMTDWFGRVNFLLYSEGKYIEKTIAFENYMGN